MSHFENIFAPSPESLSTGVVRGAEFQRIEALPRRSAPTISAANLTMFLKTPQGTQTLKQNQAEVLSDLYDFDGAFGMQGVGAGKTLISLLAPVLMRAVRPVLLVPAALKYKTEQQDIPFYRQHWQMHPDLRVLSNQTLQTLANKDLLFRYMPDLIVLDEAHEYRNLKAARTKRLQDYLRKYPATKVLILSGTLTKRSIRDYWHLLKFALPRHCPLPLHWQELMEWSEALDQDMPDNRRRAPGALMRFCAPGENVRQGFRRRLVETPGVVATVETSCDASLNIIQRTTPPVPAKIVQAFDSLRRTATTPSGDELTDQQNVWRRCKELAFGFYYRWVWPNGRPDVQWLVARRNWRKFVRRTLEHNRRGLDSDKAVHDAVVAGVISPLMEIPFGENETMVETDVYAPWVAVRDRWHPIPPRETIWVSDFLIVDAARWLAEHKGLVWVEHDAVGRKLSEVAGVPYFGASDNRIVNHQGPCIASVHAHGKGQNLQRYPHMLCLSVPSGGDVWEQKLGRAHRQGQEADEVTFEVYLHCQELWSAFAKARGDAAYIEDSTGQKQRLQLATISVLTADQVLAMSASGDPLWKA